MIGEKEFSLRDAGGGFGYGDAMLRLNAVSATP